MLKFHDIVQNDVEWFELRGGKLTASKLGVIMANYDKAFGSPAKNYAVKIALEQIKGKYIESGYSNDHMLRGVDQEPIARELYEEETFCDVKNGGFFCSDTTGDSPDGLVNDDGVIEIKSVIYNIQYANIKRGGFDPAYKWQCVGHLKYTGRDWIDFISYCAEFPEGKQLYIFREYRKNLEDEFLMIEKREAEFLKLVEESKQLILNS